MIYDPEVHYEKMTSEAMSALMGEWHGFHASFLASGVVLAPGGRWTTRAPGNAPGSSELTSTRASRSRSSHAGSDPAEGSDMGGRMVLRMAAVRCSPAG